jgi:hypothetical protein
MKLHVNLTANRRISNPPEAEMMKYEIAALSLFSNIIMTEYHTSIFVIPCSIFVIRFFKVSFSIKLAVFLASSGAEPRTYISTHSLSPADSRTRSMTR